MQSEVEAFTDDGGYKETIDFGGTQLIYAIYLKPEAECIYAEFKQNKISVYVPEPIGRRWANSDIIGMENQQHLYGEKFLRILIEKDFKCLAERQHEDQSDAFQNPVNSSC